MSIHTLSIPMRYADKRSTSKPHLNNQRSDMYRTKSSNPPKQVGDNKRLCETIGCGTETENRLLVQISEADQVSDFERILNSNAIVCERARHVLRTFPTKPRSVSVGPRPHSAYRLHAITQAYHYFFKQHEDALQSIIDDYRKTKHEHSKNIVPEIIADGLYENLHDLSQFYADDPELRTEIESIADRIVTEEVKAAEEVLNIEGKSNVNVNLAELLSLQVIGVSPVSSRDEYPLSPTLTKDVESDGKEWLPLIMSANPDDSQQAQNKSDVDRLAQNLGTVKIDSDATLPTITFSNCCDGCNRPDSQSNPDVVIHLAVPSVNSVDESRPPM